MIKVVGLWELNLNTPLSESWLWTFVLREFHVKDWSMVPITGIIHNAKTKIDLTEYQTLDEYFVNQNPEIPRVFVDEKAETELQYFQHPENVIYVFGNAGTSPMKSSSYVRDIDKSVRIDTLNNRGLMWPHQCLLLILYDRMIKSNKKWQ